MQNRAVGPVGAQAAVLANVFEVLVDRRVHGQTCRRGRSPSLRHGHETSSDGVKLDRFCTSGGNKEIVALDGLSAPPPVFVPFEVVAAFRVVLVLAAYPDVV